MGTQNRKTERAPLPSYEEVGEAAAAYGWVNVIEQLDDGILSKAIAAYRKNPNAPAHVDCPFHQGKNGKNFRFFEDANNPANHIVAICNTCGPFSPWRLLKEALGLRDNFEAMKQVRNFLPAFHQFHREGSPVYRSTTERHASESLPDDDNTPEKIVARTRKTDRIWNETIRLDHPDAAPARRYCIKRGIPLKGALSNVRFHPSLPYYDPEQNFTLTGHWPAVVLYVLGGNGKLNALHRIYITEEGNKAPVPEPKMLMSSIIKHRNSGGGCWLVEPVEGIHDRVAVVEGPETGWAVHLATGLPVMVTINATMLGALNILPKWIRHVEIWGDFDAPQIDKGTGELKPGAGQTNALELYQRMLIEGRAPELYIPACAANPGEKLPDWNDIYVALKGTTSPQMLGMAMRRVGQWGETRVAA